MGSEEFNQLCASSTRRGALLSLVYLLPVIIATGQQHGRPSRHKIVKGLASLEVEEPPFVPSLLQDAGGLNKSDAELHISARGDLMRREAADLEGADAAGQVSRKKVKGPSDLESDGEVEVVAPAHTESEQTKLEELTEECMMEEPTAECMEKFGSYGVRKLYTESWENVQKLNYRRPGWMSHPNVQKKRIFELTLPGTANSGTFAITGEDALVAGAAPFGVVGQNFDFYQQLEMGIRAFEINVAYSNEAKLVYISHGSLMMPLATALRDMRRFLEEHEREVIFLDVRKDQTADASHLKPLTEEDKATDRIPGQLVHEAVACELKEMLASYAVLTQLPTNEQAENPTVGALTDVGGHVVYFWETQQVLCTSFTECVRTPGWRPKSTIEGAGDFAFGPPQELGKRVNATGGRKTARIIEPGCMSHSFFYTKDENPNRLMKKVKEFAKAQKAKTEASRPLCYPTGHEFPVEHTPTLMYTIDGYVTPTPEEQQVQNDRMRGVKAIYTRGEGFTVRTEAERVNYLLLSWFLKKDNQEVFKKPNVILFEFVGSAAMNILRVIEAMQARPECSFAIYCKASGSCWAQTLLDAKDTCRPEEDVLKELKEHANGKEDTTKWVIYVSIVVGSILGFCVCVACCAKVVSIMKGPRKAKEVEEPLTDQADDQKDDDHESELPGSEAASDYDPTEKDNRERQPAAG
jgi:hypothetical protein